MENQLHFFSFQILITLNTIHSSKNKTNILNPQGVRENTLHLFNVILGVSDKLHTGTPDHANDTGFYPLPSNCASIPENPIATHLCCSIQMRRKWLKGTSEFIAFLQVFTNKKLKKIHSISVFRED